MSSVSWDQVEVSLPPGKKPVTAGITPKDAARQLRMLVKGWKPVEVSTADLRHCIETRTSKNERVLALDLYEKQRRRLDRETREVYSEIRRLVQAIPTFDDLPQGSDENIVRAFIAILKSNGRI